MGKAFTSYTSDRLVYRINKELQKLNTKKILPANKWTIKINSQISKEETQMANEYFFLKGSTSLAIRAIQIKTIWRFRLPQLEW